MKELGALLWALFVTCLILALAYWFTRHVVGRMAAGGLAQGKHITILEQAVVGKEQRLLLVRIEKRIYILAATPGGISSLGELSAEEAAGWDEAVRASGDLMEAFPQTLRRMWEQRKK